MRGRCGRSSTTWASRRRRQRTSALGKTCAPSPSGCRVQGAGFRVQGAGCKVQGSGCRVQGSGSRVQGSGFSAGRGRPHLGERAPHHPRPSTLGLGSNLLFQVLDFLLALAGIRRLVVHTPRRLKRRFGSTLRSGGSALARPLTEDVHTWKNVRKPYTLPRELCVCLTLIVSVTYTYLVCVLRSFVCFLHSFCVCLTRVLMLPGVLMKVAGVLTALSE